MTTGKTIALSVQIFVGKVMSPLFNMLSRCVIVFLPRSKHLLILWLKSPFAVILEPKKINSVTVSIVSPSSFHVVMGPDAMISFFWMFSILSVLICVSMGLQSARHDSVTEHNRSVVVSNCDINLCFPNEWTPGVDDGQGGLACCNSWGRKELDTTKRLNWTELNA